MTLAYDVARCAGSYQGIHGEFGRTLHPQCIQCQRRTAPGCSERQSYMTAPEFEHNCPSRIYAMTWSPYDAEDDLK